MKIYLVGGAVRNRLLNLPIKDRDWVVVGATPKQLLDRGFLQVGQDFPVFLHPKTKEEYALARTERKSGQGYKGFAFDFNAQITLEEDLIRRDLTVNAIAQDENDQLHDPFNGISDLNHKILRHVSEAFREDPLRVLRVARFAAELHVFGFKIAESTLQLMTEMALFGELRALTPERVWIETEKALRSDCPDVYFTVLNQCQALKILFPEMESLFDLKTSYFTQNLGQISLNALRKIATKAQDPILKWTILMQFIGYSHSNPKILTHFLERIKCPNHYKQSAESYQFLFLILCLLPDLNADFALNLFQRLNVWKAPENLKPLFLLCDAFAPDHEKKRMQHRCQQLEEMFQCAATLSAQDMIAQGFAGKDISTQLYAARIDLLNALHFCH